MYLRLATAEPVAYPARVVAGTAGWVARKAALVRWAVLIMAPKPVRWAMVPKLAPLVAHKAVLDRRVVFLITLPIVPPAKVLVATIPVAPILVAALLPAAPAAAPILIAALLTAAPAEAPILVATTPVAPMAKTGIIIITITTCRPGMGRTGAWVVRREAWVDRTGARVAPIGLPVATVRAWGTVASGLQLTAKPTIKLSGTEHAGELS